MFYRVQKFRIKSILFAVVIGFFQLSCEKTAVSRSGLDDGGTDNGSVNANKKNFIPQENHKYKYTITNADGSQGTGLRWVTGHKDSSGYKVTMLKQETSFENETMEQEFGMYADELATMAYYDLPAAWINMVNKLDQSFRQAGGSVTEIFSAGFPSFTQMDNTMKEGAIIKFPGAPQQQEIIKYQLPNGQSMDKYVMTQTTSNLAGKAIGVETITTAAGSFSCVKWQYEFSVAIQTTRNGATISEANDTQLITLWTAYGIGEVKQVLVSREGTSGFELSQIN